MADRREAGLTPLPSSFLHSLYGSRHRPSSSTSRAKLLLLSLMFTTFLAIASNVGVAYFSSSPAPLSRAERMSQARSKTMHRRVHNQERFKSAASPPIFSLSQQGENGKRQRRIQDKEIISIFEDRRDGGLVEMSTLTEIKDPTARSLEQRQKKKEQNFYLNKGYLRRVIAEDLPLIFEQKPRIEVFREDVVLKLESNSLNLRTKFEGKSQLKSFYEYLRWARQIGLGKVYISVRLTPEYDPKSKYVSAKCQARISPRFSTREPLSVSFNAGYQLDNDGMVRQITISDLTDPPLRILPQFVQSLMDPARGIIGAGNALGLPSPQTGRMVFADGLGSSRRAATTTATTTTTATPKKRLVSRSALVRSSSSSSSSSPSLSTSSSSFPASTTSQRDVSVNAGGGEMVGEEGGADEGSSSSSSPSPSSSSSSSPSSSSSAREGLSGFQAKLRTAATDTADFFTSLVPKTCSTSMDCRREHAFDQRVGYECCSYGGIVNMCCFPPDDDDFFGGMLLVPEYQLVPIPVRAEPQDPYGDYGRGGGGYGGYPPY